MNQGFSAFSTWLRRGSALVLSFAVHAALLVWLMTATVMVTNPPPLQPVTLELVRLPPPPQPTPPPRTEPPKMVRSNPPRRPSPPKHVPPEMLATAPVAARPPTHAFAVRQDDWATAATTEDSGNGPRRVPPSYADAVKARIIARLEYPANSFIKVEVGWHRTINIPRQCSIPYEITVDRNGRRISHRIESCGDPVLDAAAEAALLKAGPFPPPPDLGADKYVIYGSANFLIQTGTADSGVRR